MAYLLRKIKQEVHVYALHVYDMITQIVLLPVILNLLMNLMTCRSVTEVQSFSCSSTLDTNSCANMQSLAEKQHSFF